MPLQPELLDRIASQQTIDLTTFGRKSGLARRIEIWWFRVDGRFYITGTPGRRDWIANIRANPKVVIHAAGEDLQATAVLVDDEGTRRMVFSHRDSTWYSSQAQLERLVAQAPMIEILFD